MKFWFKKMKTTSELQLSFVTQDRLITGVAW